MGERVTDKEIQEIFSAPFLCSFSCYLHVFLSCSESCLIASFLLVAGLLILEQIWTVFVIIYPKNPIFTYFWDASQLSE